MSDLLGERWKDEEVRAAMSRPGGGAMFSAERGASTEAQRWACAGPGRGAAQCGWLGPGGGDRRKGRVWYKGRIV